MLTLLAIACASQAHAAASAGISVVDASHAPFSTQLAVQVCAGLMNRNVTKAGAAYVYLGKSYDAEWLKDIEGIHNPHFTDISNFLTICLEKVARGFIKYNSTSQLIVVPNLLTLAAVLDSVPLEESIGSADLVFDATTSWRGFGYFEATEYMYDNFVNQTSTMAKMNPGLDVHQHPIQPKLTGKPDLGLADFIVAKKLFNFFLNDGCIPVTRDHRLMDKMVAENPWPRPIRVYGYDDTFPVAGDLFEAETDCVKRHNLGQIATSGVNNMGFFSRKADITSPVLQNPRPGGAASAPYNASNTYMALVAGDGDNIAFIKGSRRSWLQQRVEWCTNSSSRPGMDRRCFPLLWSISPALVRVAPDMLRWYYAQARLTKSDYFVLPPSGDLYSYPSMMEPADQASFVKSTERDCELYNTSGTVAWDFVGTWGKGIKEYYPRYSAAGTVKAMFAVNVPYMAPVAEFGPREKYKILGANQNVVLFKPREWRGARTSQDPTILNPEPQELNATMMAREINTYPKGTVSNIYITSDGGANMNLIYNMVAQLDEHVVLVSADQLARMALERG